MSIDLYQDHARGASGQFPHVDDYVLEWARREIEIRADEDCSDIPINERKRRRGLRRRDGRITRAECREYLQIAALEYAS